MAIISKSGISNRHNPVLTIFKQGAGLAIVNGLLGIKKTLHKSSEVQTMQKQIKPLVGIQDFPVSQIDDDIDPDVQLSEAHLKGRWVNVYVMMGMGMGMPHRVYKGGALSAAGNIYRN